MSVVGIDVGTTHIKAVLFDAGMHMIRVVRKETPCVRDGVGRVVMNAEALFDTVVCCLRDVCKTEPGGCGVSFSHAEDQVEAIGVAGMAEAGVPLDADGTALYPVIPWQDMRASEQSKSILSTYGRYFLYEQTGQVASPKYPMARFLWFTQNEPAVMRRLDRWLPVPDYIARMLGAEAVTDVSQASRTMLYDIRRGQWMTDLARDLFGTDRFLPPVVDQGERTGVLSPGMAQATGLAAGIPIVSCGHDHVAALFALGVANGMALDSTGTSEVLIGVLQRPRLDRQTMESGFSQGCARGGRFSWMSTLPSSGGSVEWLRHLVSGDALRSRERHVTDEVWADPYAWMDRLEGCGEHPTGKLFFPWLAGSGTPYVNPDMRGVWMGLDRQDTPETLVRSVYEGVTFSLRAALASAEAQFGPVNRLVVGGGATRSRPWMEIRSQGLSRDLWISSVCEPVAAGAAEMAGMAVGLLPPQGGMVLREQPCQLLPHQATDVQNGLWRREYERHVRWAAQLMALDREDG